MLARKMNLNMDVDYVVWFSEGGDEACGFEDEMEGKGERMRT